MWYAGMEEVEEYIMQRQNTVIQYNSTQPLLDQCEEEVQQTGMWVYEWWWYQEGLVLEKARTAALTAGKTEGVELHVRELGVSQVRRIK